MTLTSSMTLMTPRRLLRSLRKNPIILQALLKEVTPSQASQSPSSADEWSILEILCHLRDYEEHFFHNTQLILREGCPLVPLPQESASLAREKNYRQEDLTKVCTSFLATRQTLLQTLNDISEEQWMRKGIHNNTLSVTLKEVILQVIMHDIDHIEQITHLLND